jgi:hypothetical protein
VAQMTPAIERLVRLMTLLPEQARHPLWESVLAGCGDAAEVVSMHWFVGDAAKMWPEAGPRNLATAVLTAFGAPSQATLSHISDALGAGQGPQAGAAWVAQASAAAVDVLAFDRPLEEVLQEVKEHWTLRA